MPSTEALEVSAGSRFGVYERLDVGFESPSGGRIAGRVHIPIDQDAAAGVILLHGSGGRALEMDREAQIMACSGMLTLAIDAPNAGRGDAWVTFTEADYEEQIRLIKDLRYSVDVLVDHFGADPDRVGFLGFSYGAALGSLFVGVDERLAAAALLVGDGGLVAHFTDSTGEPITEVAHVPDVEEWLELMAPIEPSLFLGDAAPTPILMISAINDLAVEGDDANAWHESAGEGSEVQWVETGHNLNAPIVIGAIEWLADQLGQPTERLAECAPD
jgi:predicted esterase